jgi:hypothetical protein
MTKQRTTGGWITAKAERERRSSRCEIHTWFGKEASGAEVERKNGGSGDIWEEESRTSPVSTWLERPSIGTEI